MKNLIPFVLYLIFSLSSLAQNVSYKIQTPYACASVSSATDRVGLVVEQLGSSQVKFYLVKLSSGCSSSPNATFSKVNPFTVYESNGTQIGTANTVQGKGYSEAVNHTLPTSFTSGTKQYYAKIPAANATVGNVSITATMTPYLTLGFNSTVVSSTTGTNSVSISSNTSWTVTSSNTAWLLPRVSSGANNQTVSFDYQANTSLSSRSAKLIFKTTTLTQEITVVQNGATPTLSLSTNTASVNATQGQSNVNVYSNTSWTASSNAAWLIPRTASGTGNQNVVFEYQVNTSTSARSGNTIFKSGNLIQTFTVTQAVSEEEAIKASINFSNIDVSRRDRGIVIYSDKAGTPDAQVVFAVDLKKGASIDFGVTKSEFGKDCFVYSTNSSCKANGKFERWALNTIYNEEFKRKGSKNVVAVVNGIPFESGDICNLSFPAKIGGIYASNNTPLYQPNGTTINARYYQKLGIQNGKAFISNLFDSNSSVDMEALRSKYGKSMMIDQSKYGIVSANGIVGWFINYADVSYDKSDNITAIGVADGNDSEGYNKLIIYSGKTNRYDLGEKIWKTFKVPYSFSGTKSEGSNVGNNTRIIQLDGGGSSQCYGIQKNGNNDWYTLSSDYQDYTKQVKYGPPPRKVPQYISIITATSNARISATDSTTSTELLDENGDGLTIYPNPNKDGLITVTYALPKDIQSNEASVSISNLLGQTLHQQALSEVTGTLQFNLSNQPTGNYIVTLQVGSHRISKKVILQQ